jgi:hypothetical protein
MKTKTVGGTNVEILGTCGCNCVIVSVEKRTSNAQVDAKDLIQPVGEMPVELSELKFHVEVTDSSSSSEDKEEISKKVSPIA